MKSSRLLRVGFIGAGKHAQSAHLRHYTALEECRVAAIADADGAFAACIAQRYGIEHSYSSHQEMLKKEKLDGVVLTLPPIPAAERAICDVLRSGLPLISEKPLAYSPAAGDRILEAVRDTGTPLAVAFHKRCDPATIAAIDQITEWRRTGAVGRMTYVRIHVSLAGDWIANGYRGTLSASAPPPHESPPLEEYPGMNTAQAELFRARSGSAGHQVDLMRHLVGAPFRLTYVDPSQILLAGRSAEGVPVAFEFTPYASTREWVEEALIAFEHGYVRLSLPAPLAIHVPGSVEIFRDATGPDAPAVRTTPVLPRECAMERQARTFLAMVRGETTPLCDAEQARECMDIIRQWTLWPADEGKT